MSLSTKIENRQEGVFIAAPSGAIDSSTYKSLYDDLDSIIRPGILVLILDMSGVHYISSMGFSALIKVRKQIGIYGGTLLVSDLQPQVKKVFEVMKALPSVNIFESREEADAYFDKIQSGEIPWSDDR